MNLLKRLPFLLMLQIVLCALAFTSCTEDDEEDKSVLNESNVEGVWQLTSLKHRHSMGEEWTIDETSDYTVQVMTLGNDGMGVALLTDGTEQTIYWELTIQKGKESISIQFEDIDFAITWDITSYTKNEVELYLEEFPDPNNPDDGYMEISRWVRLM